MVCEVRDIRDCSIGDRGCGIRRGRRGLAGEGAHFVPEGVVFECVGVFEVYFTAGCFHHVVATEDGGDCFVG